MKTKEQVVIFIKTLEDLIPKLKLKQQEYLIQGNEFGYNVLKDKIKERIVELNTARWFIDESTNDKERQND